MRKADAGPPRPTQGGPNRGVMDKIEKLDKLIHDERHYGAFPNMPWEKTMSLVQDGLILELGVYEGQSFYEICKYIHPRKVYGFDSFYGITEDWGIIGSKGSASRDGVPPDCPENGEFIIGRVEYTLPRFISQKRQPVAFVHFDMDTYTPTRLALSLFDNTHSFFSGTILAFDEIDEFQPWNTTRNIDHEQRAFREWLRETEFDFEIIGRRHSESWIVRLI